MHAQGFPLSIFIYLILKFENEILDICRAINIKFHFRDLRASFLCALSGISRTCNKFFSLSLLQQTERIDISFSFSTCCFLFKLSRLLRSFKKSTFSISQIYIILHIYIYIFARY